MTTLVKTIMLKKEACDLCGTLLSLFLCEKDLGVHVDPSLHFSQHCAKAASKANQIVGLVKRTFSYMDIEMMTQLIKGLIRPLLEYGNAAWSPLYKKDATVIESVQRRATKLVPKLRGSDYESRLRAMKLPSLVYRRMRGDMIECFKYMHKVYKVKTNFLIPEEPEQNEENGERKSKTRGHDRRIPQQRSHLDVRKNFFSVRVANIWNNLPESVVEASSVDTFKSRFDKHFRHLKFCTDIPLIPRYQRWEECHKGDTTEESTDDEEA